MKNEGDESSAELLGFNPKRNEFDKKFLKDN